MAAHGKLELTPRLRQLADWVGENAAFADIGTDHGYLPVWLVLNGRVSSAIASDLRPGPLAHAQATAAEYGVSGRVQLRLGDGLRGLGPQDADTIAIAGMGGENIALILSSAPWTADGQHRLLLQPMSRSEVLREFLAESGYVILREALAEDRGTLYPVLEAVGGQMHLSPGQLYGGAALTRDPLEERYLIERIIQLQRAVAGLNQSSFPCDREKADHLRDAITSLLAMREEWRHDNCPGN
jgi:Predicted SAM-dependent methyltransferase